MKKKIFLMVSMVAALVCVFAISAFAEEIVVSKTESAEYGTVIQLNADPGLDNAKQYVSTLNKIVDAGTDNDALCILTDGDADNPSYYVFPSSYIVDEREDSVFDVTATPLATAMAEFNTANGTSYFAGYETIGSGGSKRINAVARFVFPSSVTGTNVSVCAMREYPKLVEIRMNHRIDFSKAEKMFYKNTKLATFIGFENADGTKLYKGMFASCSSLRYIKLPLNIKTIPGSFFQGATGVNIVNMAELTQLTTIDSWAFDGTQNLVITLPDSVTTINTSAFESAFKTGGSITINPTSQLATIANYAFSGSLKLESIYIPSTVTSIGSYAFKESGVKAFENFGNCQITTINKSVFEAASNFTSIKIPETVTTIDNAFLGNTSLKIVYIPTSVTTIADTFTKSTWKAAPENLVFLYIGKDASVLSACAQIAGANIIPASEYDESTAYTGINLVLGYSHCIAYNGGVHSDNVTTVAVTSYLDDIKVLNACQECGIGETAAVIPAPFKYQGYSAPENGIGGIAIGFSVNSEAIKEYERVAGTTLKYGVFVVLKDKLGDNNIFGENGEVAQGVINAEIASYDFVAFELKIVGFSDEQKDVKLAMGAYVAVTDNETAVTEYSYLQESAPAKGEKYFFASYNEMVELAK